MNLTNYTITAVICFVLAIIYMFATSHPNDKGLPVAQKIFYSVIAALIIPLILLGALTLFGIGLGAHGE